MSVGVHQVVAVLERADAVGDEIRALRAALRARGYASDVFAPLRRPGGEADVADLDALLTGPAPAAVLYHFATASPATARLVASDLPLVLIHHNITPPHFFWGVDVAHHEGCRAAIDELPWLRDRVLLAVGHSEFTRRHLETLGFRRTAAVPLMLGEQPQPELPPGRLRDEIAAAPTLLSVGRIAPNKRLEDTVRLLHAYRQGVEPRARLWIVGDGSRLPRYRQAVERLVLDLGEQRAVRWLGRLDTDDLRDCYAGAAAYVSMSEHEGFGGPLLEAMQAGLPVIAYDAGATAETLGGAGVVVRAKQPLVMAELLARLVADTPLRRHAVAEGRRRAAALAPQHSIDALVRLLGSAGVPAPP